MTRDPREALRAWRESIPYSQGEVGALFGVSKSAVGNWEQGRARVPRRVQARLQAEGWLLKRFNLWAADQDAWLLDHAGRYTPATLAVAITEAFGVPRSLWAVRHRLYSLGENCQVIGLLSREQIAVACGTTRSTVQRWVKRGLLCPPAGALSHRCWAVPPATVHAFITAHAVQLDVAAMPPGPFRDQAAAIWARERWLDCGTARRYAGVARSTFAAWARQGKVPTVRQYRVSAGACYMVRARDLAAFLRQREAA